MPTELETLKAWCHWKKLEKDVSLEDLDFVRAIENTIAQVNNYKTRYEKAQGHCVTLKAEIDALKTTKADLIHRISTLEYSLKRNRGINAIE